MTSEKTTAVPMEFRVQGKDAARMQRAAAGRDHGSDHCQPAAC